jgi:hypothetical protein
MDLLVGETGKKQTNEYEICQVKREGRRGMFGRTAHRCLA